jgi:hypothetical protein
LQAWDLAWHKGHARRACAVEVVRSDGATTQFVFPRLPHNAKKYISSRSRDKFLSEVDRTSPSTKHEGMLQALHDVEVGVHRPQGAGCLV